MIRFLWSEGVSGAEIHRSLSAQYGNRVLPQRSVYEWTEKLKNVRTSVTHEGSGACVSRCAAKNMFFYEGVKKLVQQWKKYIENKETMLKNYVIISFLFLLK